MHAIWVLCENTSMTNMTRERDRLQDEAASGANIAAVSLGRGAVSLIIPRRHQRRRGGQQ
jgi:hypothetical protein